MPVKNAQQIYDEFRLQIQNQAPQLSDFNEGSLLDIFAGVISQSVSEINSLLLDEFSKTFFDTANGPEVTGGPDDLQKLFIDHFGSEFGRPQASKASGVVTFSRENTSRGQVIIPAGTVVKSPANASGLSQRFEILSNTKMTGISINASVRAILAGTSGNVQAETITEIEGSLTDPTVKVINEEPFSGGSEIATDAEYREFARNLLVSLRGANIGAIMAAAKTVNGVETVFGQEYDVTVKEWDESNLSPIGDAFKVARVKLFVADANGTASPSLISEVQNKINNVRAAGVKVEVVAATAVKVNVIVSFVLNVSGPNYSVLSVNPQAILDDVSAYINSLEIGEDFIRSDLKEHILNSWGPEASEDLTDFTIVNPVADVSSSDTQKLVSGTVGVF